MSKRTILYIRELKGVPSTDQQRLDFEKKRDEFPALSAVCEETSVAQSIVAANILQSLSKVSGSVLVVWRIDALAGFFETLEEYAFFVSDLLNGGNDLVSLDNQIDTRKEKGSVLRAVIESYSSRIGELKIERQRIAMFKLALMGERIGRPRQFQQR